ncbi:MAG: N-6 DNA methylase [Planctomycetes bacterium]|nr:N-6 DNA methylase [Planctomycetota bacterium]
MPDFSPRSHAAEIKHDPRKDDYITDVRLLGETGDSVLRSSHDTGAVLEITHGSENDPRVSITREAFRVFRQTDLNIGLMAFVSEESPNWRLSLITSDVVLEDGEVKESFSNPRRYSFFMGPDAKTRTPREFLLEKGTISDFDDLKARFDVRVLTKEFYQELSNWYFWALDNITFPEGVQEIEGGRNVAVIRMITRIVFIWFMKRKGLIPERLFEEDSVRTILRDMDPQKNSFYKAILQNLFFATLNTPIEDRGFRERRSFQGKNKDFMNHSIYRYEDLFQNPDEIMGYFKDIPFLNGGLFECLDDRQEENGESKYTRIDGFSDRDDNPLNVPNSLFWSGQRNVDISEYFETGHTDEPVRGLINILSDYNFTVDENTPIDQEVSLDPELLGRIFENLLASYNPETSTTARKATGSYYTPRPIVDYMVDESLKRYFEQTLDDAEHKLEDTKAKLDDLLSYENEGHAFSDDQVGTLIDSIESVRIIDPAVGSGAFPVGVLQKMVLLLSKLDPNNKAWKKRQIEAIKNNVTDPELKRKLLKDVERDFDTNNLNYGRKLYLIEKCIYGVDIQPIAIQIAKLRFFISLLVDESPNDHEPNYGIKPLPNLETQFVAANSLIGIEQNSDSLFGPLPEIADLEEKLTKVRAAHFNASRPKEKNRVRKKDEQIRKELVKKLEELDYDDESLKMLAAWDPYDPNNASDFFDPEWMFGVMHFDLVIANPPYVQIQKLPSKYKKLLSQQNYDTFSKTSDLYCLFYEHGVNILQDKGLITFISSNKFFRSKYGKSLRKLLTEELDLITLINFGELPVFTAGTDPCIVLAAKRSPQQQEQIEAAVVKNRAAIHNVHKTMDEKAFGLDHGSLKPSGWTLEPPEVMALLDKIRSAGTPLEEYVNGRFYRGVLTGRNKAFVIDGERRDRLIDEDSSSAEVIKPWLRGRDIKRWYADYNDLYVINIQSSSNKNWPWSDKSDAEAEEIFQKHYPAIYAHLKPYREKLIARYDQGRYYWELRSCSYNDAFECPKIVYADIAKVMRASYDQNGMFCANTMYILPTDSLFLLGFLNGRVFDWYARNTFQSLGDPWKGGRLRFIAQYVGKVPLPTVRPEQKSEIESIVDEILKRKKQDSRADVSELESKIDQFVYELYDLTDEEIRIVEEKYS